MVKFFRVLSRNIFQNLGGVARIWKCTICSCFDYFMCIIKAGDIERAALKLFKCVLTQPVQYLLSLGIVRLI